MSSSSLSTAAFFIGLIVASFSGSAIARHAGFGDESWLMGVFALGILLISQGPIADMRRKIAELERKIAAADQNPT